MITRAWNAFLLALGALLLASMCLLWAVVAVLLLPLSISGFGIPQGVIVWLLGPHGVPEPDALALSTLIVLSGVMANLPGAWLWLRRKPADNRKERTQA